MADGSLLIEVANERQSDLASNLTKLHDFVVSSTAHKTLNVIKGVITCRDLQHCSDQEILDNLRDQGVVEIYRFPQKRGVDSPSSNFTLTFKLHHLPPRIFVGWYSVRVRPYFSPPMRCFACQRFGHTSVKCSFEPICPSCGHHPHPDEQCSLPAKCINCDDSHSPRYKGCSRYKIEFEISKIKTAEKINYFEAKRKYLLQHPPQSTLFSTITKVHRTKMVSVSTQCDLRSNISPSPSTPLVPPSSSSFLTPTSRPSPPSSSPTPKKSLNLHTQSSSSQSPSPTSHLPPPSTNRIPTKPPPKSPSDLPFSSSHPKPLSSPSKTSSKTSFHTKDDPHKSNKPDHKLPPPKSTSSKNTISRSSSISTDKPKRKPSRSAKSSSASSSESILELSSSESMLIDPSIP